MRLVGSVEGNLPAIGSEEDIIRRDYHSRRGSDVAGIIRLSPRPVHLSGSINHFRFHQRGELFLRESQDAVEDFKVMLSQVRRRAVVEAGHVAEPGRNSRQHAFADRMMVELHQYPIPIDGGPAESRRCRARARPARWSRAARSICSWLRVHSRRWASSASPLCQRAIARRISRSSGEGLRPRLIFSLALVVAALLACRRFHGLTIRIQGKTVNGNATGRPTPS
jgi:hypothetical protein